MNLVCFLPSLIKISGHLSGS